MWTAFRMNNLATSDKELTIWHLPVEKRTGFADLFRQVIADPDLRPASDAHAMGLTFANYQRLMGWPRRNPRKLAQDLRLKIAERLHRPS